MGIVLLHTIERAICERHVAPAVVRCTTQNLAKGALIEWGDRGPIVTEAKTLWGARFFVITGGEPFAYRSHGKGIHEPIQKAAGYWQRPRLSYLY